MRSKQRQFVWAVCLIPGACLATNLTSHSGTNGIYEWFNVDGAEHTIAYGTDWQKIVGTYEREAVSPTCNQQAEDGFFSIDDGKHVSKLHFPGSTSTEATAISRSHVIAGIYSKDCDTTDHGFVYKNGKFKTKDLPATAQHNNKTLTVTSPDLRGINEDEDIAGGFFSPTGGDYGFLLDHEGKFTVLDPCDDATISGSAVGCLEGSSDGWGLDNHDPITVVGHYEDNVFNICELDDGVLECSNHHHGFIFTEGSGYTSLSCDGDTASDTDANGINDAGLVVGRCDSKGFVLMPPYDNDDWVTFSVSATACPTGFELNKTIAYGINNANTIVGNYRCENTDPKGTPAEKSFGFEVELVDLLK